MNMVTHETESVKPVAVSLTRFLEDLVKAIPVLVVGENVLLGIASHDNVVNCCGSMYTWFSCHG